MVEYGFPQFGEIERRDLWPARITEVARQIRVLCGQATHRPFEPRDCARFFGLQVLDKDLPGGLSGRLSLFEITPTIELQADHNELRKRFTLCHELAHLCFLQGKPIAFNDRFRSYTATKLGSDEERLCDRIAVELLMPPHTFFRQALALEPSCDAVEQLQDLFGASKEAVLKRLSDLRTWSFGYAKWDTASLKERRGQPYITVGRGIKRRTEKEWIYRQISEQLSLLENMWAQRADCGLFGSFDTWRRRKEGFSWKWFHIGGRMGLGLWASLSSRRHNAHQLY